MSASLLQSAQYPAEECELGVVHLGLGAFHRAHQAVFLDDLMQASGDLRWGIAAVNLRAADRPRFKQIASKDGYVLKTMSFDGAESFRLLRPHRLFVDWSDDAEAAEALLASPSVHCVTVTVTESGYYLDEHGKLDPSTALISAELNGGPGQSIYAYLSGALAARKQARLGAITVLCCDNIRQNGRMLERNFLAYLRLSDQHELAQWVGENVTFPCSMVDRITPQPHPQHAADVATHFDRIDDPTVMAEDFIQWVIEDRFAGERPALEQVGVTITQDVDPFEEAKIRILNGGHTSLVYLAAQAGLTHFDQAMRDPELRAHFDALETEEVLPALGDAVPFDTRAYLEVIAQRFSNTHIGDTVERISADGFTKFPVFLNPTIEGCLARGHMPRHTLRSIASWYRFCRRARDGELPFAYVEPNWALLAPLLDDPADFVACDLLWGPIVRQYPEFAPALHQAIKDC